MPERAASSAGQGRHTQNVNPRSIMSSQEQLATWLNSAYGMEQNLTQVLENHAKDVGDHPEMQSRIQQHLDETRGHAERVKRCLEILGEKPSAMKSAMGTAMGAVHGMATGMFKDEIVKNCLMDFAAENFEIACYRSLIVAAEECGQPEIAQTCRDILSEEEEMARWLEQQIPEVTRMHLHQEAHA